MLVDRFSYAVLYRAEPEQILLVAVMHLHRRPGYWGDDMPKGTFGSVKRQAGLKGERS